MAKGLSARPHGRPRRRSVRNGGSAVKEQPDLGRRPVRVGLIIAHTQGHGFRHQHPARCLCLDFQRAPAGPRPHGTVPLRTLAPPSFIEPGGRTVLRPMRAPDEPYTRAAWVAAERSSRRHASRSFSGAHTPFGGCRPVRISCKLRLVGSAFQNPSRGIASGETVARPVRGGPRVHARTGRIFLATNVDPARRRLPRYFFDVRDRGRRLRDATGLDLADDAHAICEASNIICQLLETASAEGRPGPVSVSVRSEAGACLYEASTSAGE